MVKFQLASVLFILNCLPHFFVQTVDADSCLPLKGLFAAAFTPLDARGNLNLSAIPVYARYLKRNGIDGVEVAGTTGEGTKLSVSEKKRLISTWVRVGRSLHLKVIAQVGGIPLPAAMELARYSQSVGVDGILTLPELYYRPDTARELVYFLRNIARAAPDIPFFYYHIPQFTFVNVDLVKVFDLASKQIPNFAGMAVTVFDDALNLRTRVNNCTKVLFFLKADILAPAVLMGFRNYLLAELDLFPQLVRDIIRNGATCNVKKAVNLNERLRTYNNLIYQDETNAVPPYKQAMYLLTGINVGQARAPELPLTRSQTDDLRESLEDAGLDIVAR